MNKAITTKYIFLPVLFALFGCGNSAVNGSAVGQAKGWDITTPLICADYKFFDMSQGVMQNGSGSVSHEDMRFTIAEGVDMAVVKLATETAAIVKVTYNERRAPFCTENFILTDIKIISQTEGKP